MSAEVLDSAASGATLLQCLLNRVGEAPDLSRVMEAAWEWLNEYASVDIVSVVLLGPPDPSAYLYASAAITPGLRELQLKELASVCPRLGAELYPRRASDLWWWSSTTDSWESERQPTLLGQWPLRVAGRPSVLVRLSQMNPNPAKPSVVPLLAAAAQVLGAYVRGAQTVPAALAPPHDHSPFERLLEDEVTQARQTGRPVSLVLVEVGAVTYGDLVMEATAADLEEVRDVLRRTVRRADRVAEAWGTCLAVLMPKTDARGALIGADRLQRCLREHFTGTRPHLAFRVGIGGRDPGETEASELLARAAQAVSEARTAHSEGAFLYV